MTKFARIAVVFSGGATLGSFEAGVIDRLARSDLRPGLLVGTSIGALNAAFWAFNPAPDVGVALHEAWKSGREAHIFPHGATTLLLRIVEDHPVGDPSHLRKFLRSILGDGRLIEDARVPLAIIATDIVMGEPVVMRRGQLVPALMASAAIPGLYPPVELNGRLLVDGGLVANAGLDVVAASGIRDVVLIDLMAPASRSELTGMREVVEQALTIALARQTELDLWDFRFCEQLFEMGRESGDRLLESHLEDGKVRPGLIEPARAEKMLRQANDR